GACNRGDEGPAAGMLVQELKGGIAHGFGLPKECRRECTGCDDEGGGCTPACQVVCKEGMTPCGAVMCAPGQECCNASCGTCVKPGETCSQVACEPVPGGTPGGGPGCGPGDDCCKPGGGRCGRVGRHCPTPQ